MSLANIVNLTHAFGEEILFSEITFAIEEDSRIGLIGRNGCGKTTLLKILTSQMSPSKGQIHIAKGRKFAYLSQETTLDEEADLYTTVVEANSHFQELEKKLFAIQDLVSIDHSPANMLKLEKIQNEFYAIDGYNYETKVKLILTNLKFPERMWDQKIKDFSGGEKTRIQLAKILLQPHDILLLDEPTNHLDIDMLDWLETYLRNYDKPYLMVSHDRYFLDKTVTKILELKNLKLEEYSGNYSFYLLESAARAELQQKEYEQQQKLIKRTEEFIRKNMAGQKTNMAKSRLKMLNRMDVIDRPTSESDTNIKFASQARSGNDVYRLEDLELGYPGNVLASDINMILRYRDRVAVMGKNGCGKTTLLKILNQEMEPLAGKAKLGASLRIGYYDQEHVNLDADKTVLDTIWELVPGEPIGYVLGYLARFSFRDDEVDKIVGSLSGGEKARLYLALLIHEKPNFLILDEPTNHLDLPTVNALEEALLNFEGTIIFVSHDRYFIKRVASKLWIFKNNNIQETSEDIEELFAKGFKDTNDEKKVKPVYEKERVKRTNPLLLDKLTNEITAKEKLIDKKTEMILQWQAKFSDPDTYSDAEKVKEIRLAVQALEEEIQSIRNEIIELEDKYLELSI